MPENPSHHDLNSRHFGTRFTRQGRCEFSVWARKIKTLEVEIRPADRSRPTVTHSLAKDRDGFFCTAVENLSHGDEYRFRVNGDRCRPDPAAQFYTSDVHSWCKIIDHHQYQWKHIDWAGVAKEDLIVYELHIGTFTEQGTFLSAIERIQELVELGINAVEILPIAQTPGRWNWGYDGVGLFSVENSYGTPNHLKQLIDACHGLGVAVILDVVYNHLGPEGNYLSEFGPYFTNKHHTPWGAAWNFDDRHNAFVRQWMKQNVRQWIVDYQFDGLRLDAAHFMFDTSEKPMSIELAETFDELRGSQHRHLHMIGETNVYNASLMKTSSHHGTGFDAVWSDCLMHSLLGIAQPGLDLCHRQHHGAVDAARALHQGFLYENYPYERHDRGRRADLHSMVVGLQNHDTVGNHPQGRRLKQLASTEFQFAAAALYLLYPAIPMIFMGEEFACDNPFLFFVEFGDPRVQAAVAKGRASEFPEMAKMEGVSPLDSQTFFRSKIGPLEHGDAEMWQWYQALIRLRKEYRTLGLLDQKNLTVQSQPELGLFRLTYSSNSAELSGEPSLVIDVRLGEPSTESKSERHPMPLIGQTVLATPNFLDNHNAGEDPKIGVNEACVHLTKLKRSD